MDLAIETMEGLLFSGRFSPPKRTILDDDTEVKRYYATLPDQNAVGRSFIANLITRHERDQGGSMQFVFVSFVMRYEENIAQGFNEPLFVVSYQEFQYNWIELKSFKINGIELRGGFSKSDRLYGDLYDDLGRKQQRTDERFI